MIQFFDNHYYFSIISQNLLCIMLIAVFPYYLVSAKLQMLLRLAQCRYTMETVPYSLGYDAGKNRRRGRVEVEIEETPESEED